MGPFKSQLRLKLFLELNVRIQPILANMQLKMASAALIFCMCRLALRNVSFCSAIWPVLACQTAHFARPNGTMCNPLNIRLLPQTALAAIFDIKNINGGVHLLAGAERLRIFVYCWCK